MSRIWMIALAFFCAVALSACEPAGEGDPETPTMEDGGGGTGGTGDTGGTGGTGGSM